MPGINQPDVLFSEEVLMNNSPQSTTAVPLFIGYTRQGESGIPTAVYNMQDVETLFGGPYENGACLYYALQHYFDNGGLGGFILSLGNWEESSTVEEFITALEDPCVTHAVCAQTSITLVCVPDVVIIPDNAVSDWIRAWGAILAICRSRNGLFGIFDTPDTAESARKCLDAFTQTKPLHQDFVAAYWPRLETYYSDKDGEKIVVPPCGAVAAVMVRTDALYGVWKAPANVALTQVIRPAHSWLQAENLFSAEGASINLIRSFPGRGIRIWGCRTLISDTTSPWLFVPARRLMNEIETQVISIGRNFIFEPNNKVTWIKFTSLVYLWLRDLWLAGGLKGDLESDAFTIQIGLGETMTEEDVRQGKMIMNLGLALNSPAEFIFVSLSFYNNINSSGRVETIRERD